MPKIKNRHPRWIRSVLLSFILHIAVASASAQVDPSIQWKRMRLPHFDLVYDANHQDLADLYADRLENNISSLKDYFQDFPDRTVVVLNDRTDLTNGYATPIPYRTIVIYPVLPGPHETISDFGDWARELSLHEYTHILSFEPRRGLAKGLYDTFGSILTPNLLLPRWWLEGIAVDMETRTSEKGRLRSPYQDASIRAYVIEQKLDSVGLAEINETSIHTWPQGGRPYLFGSLLWSEMIAKHGRSLISELHDRYGGRIPYFMEGPVQDLTASTYSDFFEAAKTSLKSRVDHQIRVLGEIPTTSGAILKIKDALENFSPVISPDGMKMILLSKNDANKRSVRILRRPSTAVPFEGSQEWAEIDQRLGENLLELNPTPRLHQKEWDFQEDSPPGGTIHRLSWFPDSRKFVFDKLDVIDRYRDASDLYVFDLSQMKIERITINERAREADVSPSGSHFAFVKMDAGRTHLSLFDLAAGKSEVVYSPDLQTRISFPTYLSENEIVFSERNSKGRETLKVYSMSSRTVREILSEYPDSRYPRMTSRGLIFSSYRNGTGNSYLASPDLKSAQPLTHTLTLISGSTLDPVRNELYVSELTTEGFQIRNLSLEHQSTLPATLPLISPLLEDRYPAVQNHVPVIAKPTPEDYTASPYMKPHYWLPNFYFGSERTILGGTIASADPLGKHSYSLSAAYDSEPKELSYQLLYANNQTRATVLAKALDYRTTLINRAVGFREQNYEVDALWEMSPVSTSFFAGIGYRWLGRKFNRAPSEPSESMGPSLIATYSDIAMSGAQISPEAGQTANFSATAFSAAANNGSGENFRLYQASVQKYFSKWLPKHHAIMMRAQGQYIDRAVNPANNAFTLSYMPFTDAMTTVYLMRGYLNGQFYGKSMANYSFEYRFPISYSYRGSGTTPLFLKRVHAALVADGATVDGYSFNLESLAYDRVPAWKAFWSSGAEIKFDLTLGYHFPVTFYMGLYRAHDSNYQDGQQFALGFQL